MGETDIDETLLETLMDAQERAATCKNFGIDYLGCLYARSSSPEDCFNCASYTTTHFGDIVLDSNYL